MNSQQVLLNELSCLNLSKEDLTTLIEGYKKVELKKGDYLVKAGGIVEGYYLVIEGFFRSYVIDYEGNEVTTNFYGKDELILEESSFFMQVPTKEYIQATEDCQLWMKDFETFNDHFNQFEQYRDWGRAHLVRNFFALKQRTLSMITDHASDRYKELLENRPEIFQKASLKHIASFLGVTDTSLSRIRKEMVKK